ncbi:MAG: hypothetical protein N2376_07530 [Clostridia bacterium]|nr:hypothetical protein [Clostridia bacterium]
MKTIDQITKEGKVTLRRTGIDGGFAHVFVPRTKRPATVIFSFGGGWDHVSVSYSNRCPTWEEMSYIKDAFFGPDECVVQYHPAKSEYVNLHPYCLHLWRPQNEAIPMPPKEFV